MLNKYIKQKKHGAIVYFFFFFGIVIAVLVDNRYKCFGFKQMNQTK